MGCRAMSKLCTLPPPDGPCGGVGIWDLVPPRHWCRLTDEEVALHLLGGLPVHDTWNWPQDAKAWEPRHRIVFKRGPHYMSVVYNTKCRWVVSKPPRRGRKEKK